jgi:sugar-specific transcriptional regulator TrmB
MHLIQALSNLGMNEKEAKVYVALLQSGKATAYSVAKLTDLKKPTVYVVLDNLVSKGAVSKEPQANTSEYVAISPEELFAAAKRKIKKTKSEILDGLKNISRRHDYKVRAYSYEDMDGIREMYNKFLEDAAGKEYVAFYAHARDASAELNDFFDHEYGDKIRKLAIRRRGITVYDPTIIDKYLRPEFLKKYAIKLKALSKDKYDSNISIEVFGNLTQIFSHRLLQGVVIDNPDIARAMKQIFELVWERDDIVKFKN